MAPERWLSWAGQDKLAVTPGTTPLIGDENKIGGLVLLIYEFYRRRAKSDSMVITK